ncbi:MAG: cell division protein FtsZ [Treponema sp.]|nr:cell division protein FtsZ [Treponema sp.]MCL2250993.1 cell division protein FtsZ [Treponema sp.]
MNVITVRENQQSEFSRTQPQVLQFKPQDGSYQTSTQQQQQTDAVISKGKDMQRAVPVVIKVVSAGGGGANAINRMIDEGLSEIEFISVNTDIQDLFDKSKADHKVQIGAKTTGGWGAGGNPDIGEKAAIEDSEAIAEAVKGAHMVFVTAGMGGGTGTGSAPIIASIARQQGALTVAIVTTPFEFEADFRIKQAEAGIAKLRDAVDTLIVIPNENLFKVVHNKTTYDEAFQMADKVLCRAVKGISVLITQTGFKNTDFADVKTIMKGKGDALMGIGIGTGENRAMDAVVDAIDNPLLDETSIDGATGVLINIAGPKDMTLVEIKSIIKTIKEKCDPKVNLIHGITNSSDLEDTIQVTVIATGFNEAKLPKLSEKEEEKAADKEVINYNEYVMMIEKTKKTPYFTYLPQRECLDDIDVPAALRTYTFGDDEKPVANLMERIKFE